MTQPDPQGAIGGNDATLELALRDWMNNPSDSQIDDDLRDAAATWLETHTRFVSEKPPLEYTTIRRDAAERGLFEVVDEAMIGRKLTPSRRRLIVGNIVMAVAKWRETFRDCGCWTKADGYAFCDWHERAFRRISGGSSHDPA